MILIGISSKYSVPTVSNTLIDYEFFYTFTIILSRKGVYGKKWFQTLLLLNSFKGYWIASFDGDDDDGIEG